MYTGYGIPSGSTPSQACSASIKACGPNSTKEMQEVQGSGIAAESQPSQQGREVVRETASQEARQQIKIRMPDATGAPRLSFESQASTKSQRQACPDLRTAAPSQKGTSGIGRSKATSTDNDGAGFGRRLPGAVRGARTVAEARTLQIREIHPGEDDPPLLQRQAMQGHRFCWSPTLRPPLVTL